MDALRNVAMILFILLGISVVHGGVPVKEVPDGAGCVPFREVLDGVLIETAAAYFADNSLDEFPPLTLSKVHPLNGRNLFDAYYGKEASPRKFVGAANRIFYADPANGNGAKSEAIRLESDRIVLRDRVYAYVTENSYDLAREKFGILVYRDVSDVGDELWEEYRCIGSYVEQAESFISTELTMLRHQVGDFKFGEFLGLTIGTTLAFAMDDTGSMSDEIQAARKRSFMIIDGRKGDLDQPKYFILSPFNDPFVGPLTVTSDENKYKGALNKLRAHGGGDLPEKTLTGIKTAVENAQPGSTIFVITDAEPKDNELQFNIIAQATRKDIKLTFLLTKRMTSWLCAGFSSSRRLAACSDPSLKVGYELYEYLAQSTGGHVLVVKRKDIFRATRLVDVTLKQGTVELETRKLTQGNTDIEIAADSSISEIFVEMAGNCELLQVNSDGEKISVSDPVKVDYLSNVKFNVTTYGKYVLSFKAKTECSVKITGRSVKSFLKTLAKEYVDEKNGQKYLDVIHDQPITTDKITLLVDAYGLEVGDTVNSVDVVDGKTRKEIKSFTLENGAERHFRLQFGSLPVNTTLTAYIRGVDAKGYPFQRQTKISMAVVDVEIDCSALESLDIGSGNSKQALITIKNSGAEDNYYSVGAMDDQDFITSVSQRRIMVKGNSAGSFYVRLRVPDDALVGTVTKVTLTAKGNDDDILYCKQCYLVVGDLEKPSAKRYEIISDITTRLAVTTVRSTMVNYEWSSQEAVFYAILPLNAFITDFSMIVDGAKYPGEVKEKEAAKKLYEAAKDNQLSAGHVVSRDLSSTIFQTSLNLEPDAVVTFELKYQQVLQRIRGRYRNVINVAPVQPADNLTIVVNICESQTINSLEVLDFKSEQTMAPKGLELDGISIQRSGTTAKVTYIATKGEQEKYSPLGLKGKFVVEYDVTRPEDKISETVICDSSFTNYIRPTSRPLSKRVVFLLDDSASMYGRKLRNVKRAVSKILDGFSKEDAFAIIMYSDKAQSWDPHPGNDEESIMVKATSSYVADAKKFLARIKADGTSDILNALEIAINVMEGYSEDEGIVPHPSTDFIFLVTDDVRLEKGKNASTVISSINKLNRRKFGIHTVSYGILSNAQLLAQIANKNEGTSVQIFDDIDSISQITEFFDTIGHPVLHDIELSYSGNKLKVTSDLTFNEYYQGSEMIVTGQLQVESGSSNFTRTLTNRLLSRNDGISLTLKAQTNDKEVNLQESIPNDQKCSSCRTPEEMSEMIDNLENYINLTNTVRQMNEENDKTKVEDLKNKAISFSTESNLVVPGITALVVTKPDDSKTYRDLKTYDDIVTFEEEPEVEEVVDTPPPITTEATPTITFSGAVEATAGFGKFTFTTHKPFTASRPRLEFFGDPHFVIDIEQQITLCFNWEGEQGQIISLLHDPKKEISVNGRLITSKGPIQQTRHQRTYVSNIGISLQQKNITITVTTREITMRSGKKERLTLKFGRFGSIKRRNVLLRVKPMTEFKSTLAVHIGKNIAFRIISRINSKNEFVKDHLDFSVLRGEGISKSAVGVLGQFSQYRAKAKVSASIEFGADGKTAMLWYRNNPVEVSYHILKDYNSDEEIDCWYMADKNQLWENNNEIFAVRGILDTPQSQKLKK